MAGYSDTRQLIIDTLMGRPAGTEIQPEDHQAFALQITDYVRAVELVAGNATLIGFAEATTVPVQPDNGQAVYLSQVNRGTTVTFANFIDQNGNAISVTSDSSSVTFVTLLWNGQYWSSQTTVVSASVLTAETMRVTFTQSGSSIVSSDSSGAIKTAYDEGKYIYAVLGQTLIPLVSSSSDSSVFEVFNNTTNKIYTVTGISVAVSEFDAKTYADNLHNSAYKLAQGNDTDWSKVITHCWVKNWTGGDKRLLLQYCYRNDSTYGSGIMLYICDADLTNASQVAYWTRLTGTKTGIEILDFINLTGGYGQVSVEVNWDAIPNLWNAGIYPKPYLNIETKFIETFRVTFTQSGSVITSSNTPSEIKSALDSGKYIYAILGTKEIPLLNTTTALSVFQDISGNVVMTYSLSGTSVTASSVNNVDEITKRIIPMHVSLPMIEKTSQLQTLSSWNVPFSPELISEFFLDAKLEGTPQSGYKYYIAFQYRKSYHASYGNYIYLYKNDGTTETCIGTYTIGADAPSGVNYFEFVPSIESTYVTKCCVLLNYDALKNIDETGVTGHFEFKLYDNGYRFNQEYLFETTDNTSLIHIWKYIVNGPNSIAITNVKTPYIWSVNPLPSECSSYQNAIKEIYISPNFLDGISGIGVQKYGTKWYVNAHNSAGDILFSSVQYMTHWNNNEIINIIVTSKQSSYTGNVKIGDVIGFIVFSDISSIETYVHSIRLDFDLVKSISAFSGRSDNFISSWIAQNFPLEEKMLPFTQCGFLGITKGTTLPTISGSVSGTSIDASTFSRFFLDMKLVGTPEENTKYRFNYFQHKSNSGGATYANYITIVKSSDNWSTQTTVYSEYVGSLPPSGLKLYDITPSSSSLTGIKLLLNWDALSNLDAITGSAYNKYTIPHDYDFSMDYMLNQDYGIIPNIESHRGIDDIQPTVERIAPTVVNNIVNNGLEIQLPETIYAIVGTELNLWNDAIAYSMDKGLQSPMNYSVGWYCTVGTITNRCFRITPTAEQAGNAYNITCYLYNAFGMQVATKTVQIKVLSKDALSSSKNIVYFGDSLGFGAARALQNDFSNSDKFTGTKPTMLGTKGGDWHYEAVGGYRWADYATAGRRAFRCYITNFTEPIGLGTKYTNNGFTWTVVEVNISSGNGNILITKEDVGGTDAPETNGSLVSTGSYATIPYTGAVLQGANPLWNDETSSIDISLYKERIGLQSTDKIDAVSFQFGINDSSLASNLPLLLSYIETLYNAFISDNPDCKFIIGMTTTSGNDANGSGANYGASIPPIPYNERVFAIRRYYLTLQNSATMPNIRIAAIHPQVDRYYGYNFSTRQISQRYTETETYHTNYVHPGESGYGQMGDAYFAEFIGVLTE